jgi:glycine hydroxymethyltransferase
VAEKLAVERACTLFDAEYANVQPHSGSQANMAVYFALLQPGDTVLGMNLTHGGHLTHGSPASFSGRLFQFHHYGVDRETGCIDYDSVARLAHKVQPRLIVCGASAYPRIIDFQAFADIARDVDAKLMVDMAHIAGLVAAGQHPSPVPHADVVTSTTHKTLRGPRGGLILGNAELGARLNKEIFPGIQGGPLMHVIAAKAVAFKQALGDDFKVYQQAIVSNARKMADDLLKPESSSLPGERTTICSWSTFAISVSPARRPRRPWAVPESPPTKTAFRLTNGARPSPVASGSGHPSSRHGGWGTCRNGRDRRIIHRVLCHPADETVLADVRRDVQALCRRFPIYPGNARG